MSAARRKNRAVTATTPTPSPDTTGEISSSHSTPEDTSGTNGRKRRHSSVPVKVEPADDNSRTRPSPVLDSVTSSASNGGRQPQAKKEPICQECDRVFNRHHDLIRHIKTVHDLECHMCHWCKRDFSRKDALVRHQRDCQRAKHNAGLSRARLTRADA